MLKTLSFNLIFILLCMHIHAQLSDKSASDIVQTPYNLVGQQVFIENRGQLTDSEGRVLIDVLFKLRLPGTDVYFRKTGLSFMLQEKINPTHSTANASNPPLNVLTDLSGEILRAYRMDLLWENSNAGVEVLGSMPADQTFNYYYGHCPNGITNVPGFEKLTYRNVYQGIDLEFYTKEIDGVLRLKYDIVVHPGADPKLIQLKYHTDELPAGVGLKEISFNTPLGTFQEQLGQIYQTIEDRTALVEGNYSIKNGLISFDIPRYDPAHKLIIDPVFFTYYGGNSFDFGEGIDTDRNNNVLAVGTSDDQGLFVTPGLRIFSGGNSDVFVVKLDPRGNRIWATYFGGGAADVGNEVTVDTNNRVFFTGITLSNNFPTTLGGPLLGSSDAYVVCLNDNGTRSWARYHGGEVNEAGWGIATDNNNNIIICGSTSSSGFPVGGCLPSAYRGGSAVAGDAFISRFNNDGTIMLWSTYLGGTNDEIAYAVTTDENNNVLVTGFTESDAGFTPALTPARNSPDVFLVVYDPICTFLWGRRYGGVNAGAERGNDVAADPVTNDIVVVGSTLTADFPTTPGVVKNIFDAPVSSIITKFNAAGVMQWSSYYGGEAANGVEIDNDGTIWITGITIGDINTTPTALQPNYNANNDAFVAHITANGQNTLCASYYGGSASDEGNAIALNSIGNVLICGTTASASLPRVGAGSLQPNLNAGQDAFIASICTNCGLPQDSAFIVGADTVAYPNDTISICAGDTVHLMNLFDFTSTLGYRSVNYNGNQATFSWRNMTAGTTANLGDPTVKAVAADNAWIKVSPTDTTTYRLISKAIDCRIDTSYITVAPIPAPTAALAFRDSLICAGDSLQLRLNLGPAGPFTIKYRQPTGGTQTATNVTSPFTKWVTAAGNYIIDSVKTSSCASLIRDTLKVRHHALPTAGLNGGGTICTGDSAQIRISLTGTPNWQYSWIVNGTPQGDKTQTVSDSAFYVKTTTTYKITAVADSMCANTANTTVTVTVVNNPSARITNTDDTLYICPGGIAPINLSLTGPPPFKLEYSTPSGTETKTGLGITYTINASARGWYKLLKVTDNLGCDSVLMDSIFVEHHPVPTASFTLSKDTICLGDSSLITINLTGKPDFQIKHTGIQSGDINTTGMQLSWQKWLKPTVTSTYGITNVKDANGCERALTQSDKIVVNSKPVVSAPVMNCNAQSTQYNARINLSGGAGSGYTANIVYPPALTGSWSGSAFITGMINTCDSFEIHFDDPNLCGPVIVKSKRCCQCQTEAGTMDLTPQLLCEGDLTSDPHKKDTVLDSDDIMEYLLHTGGVPPNVKVIARNRTGKFQDPGGPYPSTYYICVVAGNKAPADTVDPSDGCYKYTDNVPVTWHSKPTISVTATDTLCPGQSALLEVSMTGSQQSFDYEVDAGRMVFGNKLSPDSITFVVNRDTTITVTRVQYNANPKCSQTVNIPVTVRTWGSPVIQNIRYNCNSTSDQYQVIFDIIGGDQGSYTVNGGNSGITNSGSTSTYTSGWINVGTSYSFSVTDRNNCNPPPPITGSYNCVCLTNAGSATSSAPIAVCAGQQITYPHAGDSVMDSNDMLEYILHKQPGSPYPALRSNTSGTFDTTGIKLDSVYYITPVAGNRTASNSVDPNDPCFSKGTSIMVIFRSLPDVSFSAYPNDSLCPKDVLYIDLAFTGNGPFAISGSSNDTGLPPSHRLNLGPQTANSTFAVISVTDAYNCTRVVDKKLDIKVAPPILPNESITQIKCFGDNNGAISLAPSGGFGNYSYNWGSQSTATISNLNAGSYTVRISDYLSCDTNITYTLSQPPQFNISFLDIYEETCFNSVDGKIEVGAPKLDSARMIGGVGRPWQDSGLFVDLNYDDGTHNLTIEVRDSSGCMADSVINVNGVFPVTLAVAPQNLFVCRNEMVTMQASGSGGRGNYKYYWNSETVDGGNSRTIQATQLSESFKVYCKDINGCPSNTQTITITTPSFLSQTPSSDLVLCYGDPFTLTTAVTGGTGIYTYRWDSLQTVVGNSNSYSSTAVNSASYTITVRDSCQDSTVQTISVNVAQPVQVQFQAAPDTSGCAPLTVELMNQSQGAFDRWQWRINSGGPITDTVLSRTFSNPGSYTIELELFNDVAGCNYKLVKPQYIVVHPVARADFNYFPTEVTLIDPSVKMQNLSLNTASYQWTLDSIPISILKEPEVRFRENEAAEYLLCLNAHTPFNCNDTSCVTIVVRDEVTIYIPSGFTPNDDGINEVFKAEGGGLDTEGFLLQVYDRWGTVVFESTDINVGWDGTYAGEPAKNDVYVWKLKARAKENARRVDVTGKLLVFR